MIICIEKDSKFNNYKDIVKSRKINFHIKDIFKDHWDDYTTNSNRKRRPIIDKVVDDFLKCKSFLFGYSLYTCPTCYEEKIVPHTCKTRFCPSCGNKYNEERSLSIFSKLINYNHRHVVFTIPDVLRGYFRNNRKLLHLLFVASSITVKYWFKQKCKGAIPAFVSVLHTYGRSLIFNPHIHMILLDGGVLNDKFIKVDFFSYASFRKRFMKVLLDLLEENIGKSEFRKIKNDLYFKLDNGFYVYAPKSKFKNVTSLVKYVCRYVSRPVMAESRIINYDGTYVTFWYQRHDDNLIVVEKIPVYEFIHRLIIHIPEPNFKYIRFYGLYHNSTKCNIDDFNMIIAKDKIPFFKSLNKWRIKIIKDFKIDPLNCLKCGSQMIYYKSWYP